MSVQIEFKMSALRPMDVASAVHEQGFALLRGAISRSRMAFFRERLEAIYAEQDLAYQERGQAGVSNDYLDGAITDGLFRQRTDDAFCLFDVIAGTRMIACINAILGTNYHEKFAVVRRMAPEYKSPEKIEAAP